MGDIEAMFHHVKTALSIRDTWCHVPPGIPDTQGSFLKFLWWEDSDINKGIIDYEMTADVFEGSSSPSC